MASRTSSQQQLILILYLKWIMHIYQPSVFQPSTACVSGLGKAAHRTKALTCGPSAEMIDCVPSVWHQEENTPVYNVYVQIISIKNLLLNFLNF